MSDLIEGKFYYTDRGIEKCHYCEVNGVVELVTPKGKVLAPVPNYAELQELKSKRDKLAYDLGVADVKNGELLRLLKECKEELSEFNYPQYSSVQTLLSRINAAIGESEEK